MKEYIEAIRWRYRKADRRGKGQMLEEVTQVTGYHRKSAIRLLRAAKVEHGSKGHRRPRAYGPGVVHALKVVWEVADRVCSKRLAPFAPELVQVLERHGEMTLAPEVKAQIMWRKSSPLMSSHPAQSRATDSRVDCSSSRALRARSTFTRVPLSSSMVKARPTMFWDISYTATTRPRSVAANVISVFGRSVVGNDFE